MEQKQTANYGRANKEITKQIREEGFPIFLPLVQSTTYNIPKWY